MLSTYDSETNKIDGMPLEMVRAIAQSKKEEKAKEKEEFNKKPFSYRFMAYVIPIASFIIGYALFRWLFQVIFG